MAGFYNLKFFIAIKNYLFPSKFAIQSSIGVFICDTRFTYGGEVLSVDAISALLEDKETVITYIRGSLT